MVGKSSSVRQHKSEKPQKCTSSFLQNSDFRNSIVIIIVIDRFIFLHINKDFLNYIRELCKVIATFRLRAAPTFSLFTPMNEALSQSQSSSRSSSPLPLLSQSPSHSYSASMIDFFERVIFRPYLAQQPVMKIFTSQRWLDNRSIWSNIEFQVRNLKIEMACL
jgi:hypothetical protein